MTALSPHDQAAVDALRTELADGTRLVTDRRRDWHGLDDRDMRPLLRDPWLCDEPISDALEAEGLHQDAEAERMQIHEFDPDDPDVIHPGGPRWERAIGGEAWR